MVDVDIHIPSVDIVLADQARGIGLVDSGLQALALADELAPDIDVAGVCVDREGGEQGAFDKEVWVVAEDLPVLAGSGLGFICVDHEVMRTAVRLSRHE